ncbi:SIMPL domain-containing protein [Streptomyces sp. NPDC004822]
MATPPQDPHPAAPHGTPDAPLLTVRGEAHLDVDPEIARIGVTITSRGKDRRTALDDLTRRNAAVLDLLNSYGDAVERLETSALSLSPELKDKGRGERVHAHHGSVHLTADLTDFTALGELTTRIADLELTRVDGPWWALRPDSPAHRQARQQAVHEAVRRAREYAEALGADLAALLELADTGDGTPAPPRAGRTRSLAHAADEDTPAAPLDLEPQRQHVVARVDARFTMTPPRL